MQSVASWPPLSFYTLGLCSPFAHRALPCSRLAWSRRMDLVHTRNVRLLDHEQRAAHEATRTLDPYALLATAPVLSLTLIPFRSIFFPTIQPTIIIHYPMSTFSLTSTFLLDSPRRRSSPTLLLNSPPRLPTSTLLLQPDPSLSNTYLRQRYNVIWIPDISRRGTCLACRYSYAQYKSRAVVLVSLSSYARAERELRTGYDGNKALRRTFEETRQGGDRH